MPAVAEVDGCWVMTSLAALPDETVTVPEVAGVRVPEVKVSVTTPTLVTKSPLKVATPLTGVAVGGVVVPFKLPPDVSAAVITVA